MLRFILWELNLTDRSQSAKFAKIRTHKIFMLHGDIGKFIYHTEVITKIVKKLQILAASFVYCRSRCSSV